MTDRKITLAVILLLVAVALAHRSNITGVFTGDGQQDQSSIICSVEGGCEVRLKVERCPKNISKLAVKCFEPNNLGAPVSTHEIDSYRSSLRAGIVFTTLDIQTHGDLDLNCYLSYSGSLSSSSSSEEDDEEEITRGGNYIKVYFRASYTPRIFSYSSNFLAAGQSWQIIQQPRKAPYRREGKCLFSNVNIQGYELNLQGNCNSNSNYGWFWTEALTVQTPGLNTLGNIIPKVRSVTGWYGRNRGARVCNWDNTEQVDLMIHPTLTGIFNQCHERTNSQWSTGGNSIILKGYFGKNLDDINVWFSGVAAPKVSWKDETAEPQELLVQVPPKPENVPSSGHRGCDGLTRTVKGGDGTHIDHPSKFDNVGSQGVVYFDHVGSFSMPFLPADSEAGFNGTRYTQELAGWFTVPQTGRFCFISSCNDECKYFFNDTPGEDFSSQAYADLLGTYDLETLESKYQGIDHQQFQTYADYDNEPALWDPICKNLQEGDVHRIQGYVSNEEGISYGQLGFIFDIPESQRRLTGDGSTAHPQGQGQVDVLEFHPLDLKRQTWVHNIECQLGYKFRITVHPEITNANGETHPENIKLFNCPPQADLIQNHFKVLYQWAGKPIRKFTVKADQFTPICVTAEEHVRGNKCCNRQVVPQQFQYLCPPPCSLESDFKFGEDCCDNEGLTVEQEELCREPCSENRDFFKNSDCCVDGISEERQKLCNECENEENYTFGNTCCSFSGLTVDQQESCREPCSEDRDFSPGSTCCKPGISDPQQKLCLNCQDQSNYVFGNSCCNFSDLTTAQEESCREPCSENSDFSFGQPCCSNDNLSTEQTKLCKEPCSETKDFFPESVCCVAGISEERQARCDDECFFDTDFVEGNTCCDEDTLTSTQLDICFPPCPNPTAETVNHESPCCQRPDKSTQLEELCREPCTLNADFFEGSECCVEGISVTRQKLCNNCSDQSNYVFQNPCCSFSGLTMTQEENCRQPCSIDSDFEPGNDCCDGDDLTTDQELLCTPPCSLDSHFVPGNDCCDGDNLTTGQELLCTPPCSLDSHFVPGNDCCGGDDLTTEQELLCTPPCSLDSHFVPGNDCCNGNNLTQDQTDKCNAAVCEVSEDYVYDNDCCKGVVPENFLLNCAKDCTWTVHFQPVDGVLPDCCDDYLPPLGRGEEKTVYHAACEGGDGCSPTQFFLGSSCCDAVGVFLDPNFESGCQVNRSSCQETDNFIPGSICCTEEHYRILFPDKVQLCDQTSPQRRLQTTYTTANFRIEWTMDGLYDSNELEQVLQRIEYHEVTQQLDPDLYYEAPELFLLQRSSSPLQGEFKLQFTVEGQTMVVPEPITHDESTFSILSKVESHFSALAFKLTITEDYYQNPLITDSSTGRYLYFHYFGADFDIQLDGVQDQFNVPIVGPTVRTIIPRSEKLIYFPIPAFFLNSYEGEHIVTIEVGGICAFFNPEEVSQTLYWEWTTPGASISQSLSQDTLTITLDGDKSETGLPLEWNEGLKNKFLFAGSKAVSTAATWFTDADDVDFTLGITHKLAGMWLLGFDTCEGRILNTSDPEEIPLVIDSTHLPSDLNTDIDSIMDGATLVFVMSGAPKDKDQAEEYGFTASINNDATIKIKKIKNGQIKAKIRLPRNAVDEFIVTFEINGKQATKNLTRIVEGLEFEIVADPGLNEYEYNDVEIKLTDFTNTSSFGCDQNGPGDINNEYEDSDENGLLVKMIDQSNEDNFVKLRIISCPDNETLIARYPKAAPSTYDLEIYTGEHNRNLRLIDGGLGEIHVGVIIQSLSSNTGAGGVITINAEKLPLGGPGAQEAGLAEYLVSVGPKNVLVPVTRINVQTGEIDIFINPDTSSDGDFSDGSLEVCVMISLVPIRCGADILVYDFDSSAGNPSSGITGSIDLTGDDAVVVINGQGLSTDITSYNIFIGNEPVVGYSNQDLLVSSSSTELRLIVPYSKSDDGSLNVTVGPFNGSYYSCRAAARGQIVVSQSGPTEDVSAGGATVYIKYKCVSWREYRKFKLYSRETGEKVCMSGTSKRRSMYFTCRVKPGTKGILDLVYKKGHINKILDEENSISLTLAQNSPIITSVTEQNGVITITGQNFNDIHKVHFGWRTPDFFNVTPTSIQVDAGQCGLGRGRFDISFFIEDGNTKILNWAINLNGLFSTDQNQDLGFYGHDNAWCSGGAYLKSDDDRLIVASQSQLIQILVGDQVCQYESAQIDDKFLCELPELLSTTLFEDPSINHSEARLLNSFKVEATNVNSSFDLLDGDFSNEYSPSGSTDTVIIDLVTEGSSAVAAITEFAFYVDAEKTSQFAGNLFFEGRNFDGEWELISAITGSPLRENFIVFENNAVYVAYQQVRMRCETADACRVSELLIRGHILNDSAAQIKIWYEDLIVDTGITFQCDDVIPNYVSHSVARNNDNYGGNTQILDPAGDETVTLTFDQLNGVSHADVWIYNRANPCLVTINGNEIEAVTRARPDDEFHKGIDVIVPGKGRPWMGEVDLCYGYLYSSPDAWGKTFGPQEGFLVHVPKGQALLVDKSTPQLGAILVEGKLVVKDNGPDGEPIEIKATYIMVHNGGSFQAGTPDNRYCGKLIITLYGHIQTPELPQFGNKVIGVKNGSLKLHGCEVQKPWTHIASTIDSQNPTQLYIDEDVTDTWKVGMQIVVASTNFNGEQAERRTIEEIEFTNGQTHIVVSEDFEFKHFSGIHEGTTDEAGVTHSIEMRAEVGLLTRSIVVQGDPEDSARDKFGGHIMFSLETEDIENGLEITYSQRRIDVGKCVGELTFIEMRNVGQGFQVGRHPIYFRNIGDASSSIVQGISIYDSFNRAITVEGTRNLRIIDTVAHKIMGHGFYLKDGAQEQNVFTHNLGIDTRRSWSLLNTDQTPATFYISNPNNNFEGNVAAGSHMYGYWMHPLEHPIGHNADDCIWVQSLPIGKFHANTAHSNFKYGFWLYQILAPFEVEPSKVDCESQHGNVWHFLNSDYARENGHRVLSEITDFVGYKNGRVGIRMETIGWVKISGAKIADSLQSGVEISNVVYRISPNVIDSHVSGTTVFGHTANLDSDIEFFLDTTEYDLRKTYRHVSEAERQGFYAHQDAFRKRSGIQGDLWRLVRSSVHYNRCLTTSRSDRLVVRNLNCVNFDIVNLANRTWLFAGLGSCSDCWYWGVRDMGANLSQFADFHITEGAIRFAFQHPYNAIFQDIGDTLTLVGVPDREWVVPYYQHLDFTGSDNERCSRGEVPRHTWFPESEETEEIGGKEYFKFHANWNSWYHRRRTRFLHCASGETLRRLTFQSAQPWGVFRYQELKIFRTTEIYAQNYEEHADAGDEASLTIASNELKESLFNFVDNSFDGDDQRQHTVARWDWYGWAVPFLLNQIYNVNWRFGQVYERIDIVRDKNQWTTEDPSLILSFNHTGVFFEKVETTIPGIDLEDPLTWNDLENMPENPDEIEDFPLYSMRPNFIAQLTDTASLHGFNFNDYEQQRTSIIIRAPKAGEAWGNDIVRATFLKCASFESCNPGLFAGKRESHWRKWENGVTGENWEQDDDNFLNEYLNDQEGLFDRVILPNWQMEYNAESGIYGHIDIQGVLKVVEGDRSLTCERMTIGRIGELRVGTKEQPFQGKFSLIFNADRDGTHNELSPYVNMGNKGIANFGLLSLHGKQHPGGTKARLQSTITPDDATVTIQIDPTVPASWSVGDHIGVGPSGFNYEEYEEFVITTPPSNGSFQVKKIAYEEAQGKYNLNNNQFTEGSHDNIAPHEKQFDNIFARIQKDSGAAYTHFGTDDISAYGGIDPRAEVILLTRNVKVIATEEDRWGLNIVTSTEELKNGAQEGPENFYYKGLAQLSNVEFQNFGQADTHNTGVRFERQQEFTVVDSLQQKFHHHDPAHITLPFSSSIVQNCSFNRGWGWGVLVKNVDAYNGLYIFGNTIFSTTLIGIEVTQSSNVWVHDNWVVGVKDRHFVVLDGVHTDAIAGIAICARQQGGRNSQDKCLGNKVTQNVVSGSADIGFIIYGSCETQGDLEQSQTNVVSLQESVEMKISEQFYPFSDKKVELTAHVAEEEEEEEEEPTDEETPTEEEGNGGGRRPAEGGDFRRRLTVLDTSAEPTPTQQPIDQNYTIFHSNTARVNSHGFLIQRNDALKCQFTVAGFLDASYSTETAVVTYGKFEEYLHITNVITAHSHQGISINLGGKNDINVVNTSVITDSVIQGELYDESTLSSMTGLITPASAVDSKTWPARTWQLPWLRIRSESKLRSYHYGYRIKFLNFQQERNLSAIGDNPYNTDIISPLELFDITFENVAESAVAGFYGWNWGLQTFNACGDFPCTGPDNIFVSINGLTVVEQEYSSLTEDQYQILNVNRTAGAYIESCTPQQEWATHSIEEIAGNYFSSKGESVPDPLTEEVEDVMIKPHYCENNNIDMLVMNNLDPDNYNRSIQPIYVESDNQDKPFSSVLNGFRDHHVNGAYASQKRQSTFAVVLDTHSLADLSRDQDPETPINYVWRFTGSPPKNMDFFFARRDTLFGDSTPRGSLVTIDFTKAGKWKASCGGNSQQINLDMEAAMALDNFDKMEAADYNMVSPNLPLQNAGEYRWVAHKNILQFFITNENQCEIRFTNSLQLNIRLDISFADFFSSTYQKASFGTRFAAAINIKPWQVSVVGLSKGSVIVWFDIVSDEDDPEAQVQSLQAMQADIESKIANGEIDLGAPILDYTIQASFEDKYMVEFETGEELPLMAIILIGLAGVICIAGIVSLIYYCRRKPTKGQRIADNSVTHLTLQPYATDHHREPVDIKWAMDEKMFTKNVVDPSGGIQMMGAKAYSDNVMTSEQIGQKFHTTRDGQGSYASPSRKSPGKNSPGKDRKSPAVRMSKAALLQNIQVVVDENGSKDGSPNKLNSAKGVREHQNSSMSFDLEDVVQEVPARNEFDNDYYNNLIPDNTADDSINFQ